MNIRKTYIWRKLREMKILRQHKRVAGICENLIKDYKKSGNEIRFVPKKQFLNERIIWQYWAQGYDDVPEVVRQCLDSVDKYASDYTIVRLTDENLAEYIDAPDFIEQKRGAFSRAHFSDILRLMLLKTYGGIWMDATIMLLGPIPEEIANQNFFVFRRDPNEPNKEYWQNSYAYYYGWANGFRVNMLSSFMVAKKGNKSMSDLCNLILLWWKKNNYLPDYFFLQILFDVYAPKDNYPLVSDCLPHYMQQGLNSDHLCPIQKLTYK